MKATMKNIFKKAEAYNEIAPYMGNKKVTVKVQFGKYGFGEKFETYKDLKKYIKEEYYPDFVATFEKVEFELDEETVFTVEYTNGLPTADHCVTVWLAENNF